MRVLHVGWGFSPWRGGGLIEYAEDLMKIQSEKGFEVFYFCSSRQFIFSNKIKLKKRKKDKVNIFEVLNSPIYHGGDSGSSQPDLDLKELSIEQFFREVLDEIKPDIIHIQELTGLPSSLIDIAKDEYKIHVIMTLHDYFLLCPTLKLFDSKNDCFVYKNLDSKCSLCCKNAPKNRCALIKTQLFKFINRHKSLQRIFIKIVIFIKSLREKFTIFSKLRDEKQVFQNLNQIYQERRDLNVSRLEKIDLLIAQSHRVEEIYRYFLNSSNIITLHSTLSHLTSIEPKSIKNIKYPISFATLNGGSSIQKGALVLDKALKILKKKKLDKYFQFHVWGYFDANLFEMRKSENLTYHGLYKICDLNDFLETIDVGIIPSIWEEVYGYVGLEFLAKGIPVIGNKKGGIVDYTIENFTGWLNESSSPEELAEIMEYVIQNPSIIQDMNKKIVENRRFIIKTMDDHFEEIKDVYGKLIENNQ